MVVHKQIKLWIQKIGTVRVYNVFHFSRAQFWTLISFTVRVYNVFQFLRAQALSAFPVFCCKTLTVYDFFWQSLVVVVLGTVRVPHGQSLSAAL